MKQQIRLVLFDSKENKSMKDLDPRALRMKVVNRQRIDGVDSTGFGKSKAVDMVLDYCEPNE